MRPPRVRTSSRSVGAVRGPEPPQNTKKRFKKVQKNPSRGLGCRVRVGFGLGWVRVRVGIGLVLGLGGLQRCSACASCPLRVVSVACCVRCAWCSVRVGARACVRSVGSAVRACVVGFFYWVRVRVECTGAPRARRGSCVCVVRGVGGPCVSVGLILWVRVRVECNGAPRARRVVARRCSCARRASAGGGCARVRGGRV